MHTYSWYALLYSKLTHIVKQLCSNKDFKNKGETKQWNRKVTGGKINSYLFTSITIAALITKKKQCAFFMVQFSSVAQLYPTLCDSMNCNTPDLPVHHQLPEFTKAMPIESVMPSSHLILCHPLLLLLPTPPSIRVFSSESTLCMRWPNYWSFSFSLSPSNEHPGLISPRMDWLDLLAVQRTLKGLLQHHRSKESIFRCSAFFTVQLSHLYMTTGKTIALTRRTL